MRQSLSAALRLVFVGLLALAAMAPASPAQTPDVLGLPKPRAATPRPDMDALARSLCEAIDAGNMDAVNKALNDGANPNIGMGAGENDTAGRTPLIHAVLKKQVELIDALVAQGAYLEGDDDAGHTPLMYAALTGNQPMVEHLLTLGARVDRKDRSDRAAADYAGESKAIEELLSRAATSQKSLLAAIEAGDAAKIKAEIAAGASPNTNDGKTSALLFAVRKGDLALARELMAVGCRVDLLHASWGGIFTPVGVAAERGTMDMLQAMLAGRPGQSGLDDALACAAGSDSGDRLERVRALLVAGARVSAPRLDRREALPAAAAKGDLATMALLIEHGATQKDVDEALLESAGVEREDLALETSRALLAIDADPSYMREGTSGLGHAAIRGHARVIELLLSLVRDEVLNSAVSEASREGAESGLRELCTRGKGRIDFGYRFEPFDPALTAAVNKGHHNCIKVLLEAGANPNQPPAMLADAPIIAAVRTQDHESIRLLLAAGADPAMAWDAPMIGRHSALDVAREMDDPAIVTLLQDHLRAKDAPRIDAVGATLARSGLHFKDIGAFYELRFTQSGKDGSSGRGQTAFLRKKVEEYETLRAQEVYSLCYDSPDPPGDDVLRKVFLKGYSPGGLVLEQPSEKQPRWRIRLRVLAPTDISPEDLARYFQLIQRMADRVENEISPGEDRL